MMLVVHLSLPAKHQQHVHTCPSAGLSCHKSNSPEFKRIRAKGCNERTRWARECKDKRLRVCVCVICYIYLSIGELLQSFEVDTRYWLYSFSAGPLRLCFSPEWVHPSTVYWPGKIIPTAPTNPFKAEKAAKQPHGVAHPQEKMDLGPRSPNSPLQSTEKAHKACNQVTVKKYVIKCITWHKRKELTRNRLETSPVTISVRFPGRRKASELCLDHENDPRWCIFLTFARELPGDVRKH